MRSNFKPLGNYIRKVNDRNGNSKIETLKGINIDKEFMPSVANTIGSNMSRYRVVSQWQFAYNPMHVGRDEVLPISMLKDDTKVIVSPAYTVFEIEDHSKLNPEYLMMWCRRSEFDRNAWFTTDNSVRGGFSWESLCEMELPVPSIEKQREIVVEYNAVVDRIELNEKISQKLEETAKTIYRQWFEEFEFPISIEYAESIGKPELEGQPYKSSGGEMVYNEELDGEIPKGWELITVGKFSDDMKNGATPKRSKLEYWNSKDIPWIKTGEVSNNVITAAEEYISSEGYKNSSTKLLPRNAVLMAMYGATAGQVAFLKTEATTNQACCAMICETSEKAAFLYYFLLTNQKEIANLANGGAQANLSKKIIEELKLLKPCNSSLSFDYLIMPLNYNEVLTRENQKLEQLKKLLLSKMTRVELQINQIIE